MKPSIDYKTFTENIYGGHNRPFYKCDFTESGSVELKESKSIVMHKKYNVF